jgi:hypothetical protein
MTWEEHEKRDCREPGSLLKVANRAQVWASIRVSQSAISCPLCVPKNQILQYW